jgi:ABC-2 type transport system permease protein
MRAADLEVLAAVGLRTWTKTLRRPVVLLFSFVQPLYWMLFFGFLFHRYPIDLVPEGVSYVSFLVPGVCAMTVLFGASQSGIGLIRDAETGFLGRMRAAPVSPALLLAGKVLADVVRLVLQAAAVAGLGLLVGARLRPAALPLLAAVACLALFALGFASLSCLIALRTRVHESMASFVHLVNMPLLFTSSALVPGRHMPPWLQTAAGLNPLSAAVDALRGAMLESRMPVPGRSLASLVVVSLALFLLAARAMGKAPDP